MLTFWFSVGAGLVVFTGFLVAFSRFYRKVGPEEALIRSGVGGLKVATGTGIGVIPVLHCAEKMDLSVKRIEIARRHEAGLICRDNIRADIEVAFFVRVNNTVDDIIQVGTSLGCARASEQRALDDLFNAKFSEALKTVGRHFDFVELYNERDKFKEQILKVIGTDLNGYVLDDCAIDYLEQTPLEMLNPQNILDAEGIKKITDLTAREFILANEITREKEKVIKKQDVEARETILELDRQKVEAEQKQEREIASVTARERAQAVQVQQEERLKAERSRIATEEDLSVAEENKQRQVIVAQRNKERTDAIEKERIEKDRLLEVTERERVVGIADISKEKEIEVEKRNIQEVIRERVVVERGVVEEQENIRNTEQFMDADRQKRVKITLAEMTAEEALVKEVKAAESAKKSAELYAEQKIIQAEAERASSEKETQAKKMLAEATAAEEAAVGIGEMHAQVAKAEAIEKQGSAEANVLEFKAVAEAKGQEAKAVATEKLGTAEASVMQQKFSAEATGIEEKANAMKLFDGVGREHEEFKLRLNKDKDIELSGIDAQKDIAAAQASLVGEALKSARIDIVGGETTFFDRIVDSIKAGKSVDRLVENSEVLSDVKNTFFNGNPEYFKDKLKEFASQFNMSFEDIKDLSMTALITKMLSMSSDDNQKTDLNRMLSAIRGTGMADRRISTLGLAMADEGIGD